MPPTIFTIGHSTRSLEDLIALLRVHGVTGVADIRSVPRSRHNPQFNRETLPEALAAAGIAYRHVAELGGLRHGLGAASPNAAWRHASFRVFADHLQTDEFGRGLAALLELGAQRPTAMLCAEALPWRCHRSLVADALLARGCRVLHIMGPGAASPHRMTPFAHGESVRVIYPAPPG